jgi:hypothetical protein
MSTGSTWTTTAAQNAATTTKAENRKAVDDLLKTEAKMKIKHEPRKVLNVSQEAVAAGGAQNAQPTKQANQSGSMSVQDTEDGTVLRWR